VLNDYAADEQLGRHITLDDMIASFCTALAKDNPRFNKDTFYDACYKVKP